MTFSFFIEVGASLNAFPLKITTQSGAASIFSTFTNPRFLVNFVISLCFLMSLSSPVLATSLIHVTGVNEELQTGIKAFLGKPREERWEKWLKQAPSLAKEALQAYGFYNAKVTAQTKEINPDEREITFQIDRGPVTQVSRLRFEIQGEGKDDPRFQALKLNFPLSLGKVFVSSEYEMAKNAFYDTSNARGYFDADFIRHEVTVNAENNTAQINILFDSGKRYKIGEIQFTSEELDPDFLNTWVPFDPNTPYQAGDIIKLSKALRNSGYFERVRVRTDYENAKDFIVPLKIETEPRAKYVGRVGFGYATDVGPRGSFKLERPYINKKGHSISGEVAISGVSRQVSFDYKIPRDPDPSNHYFNLNAGYSRTDDNNSFSELSTSAFELHDITARDWRRNVFVRWQRERFSIANTSDDTTLWMPGTNLSRTRSSGGIFPTRGEKYNLQLTGAGQAIGSDIDMMRFQANGKWLNSFAERHQIITRLDFGWLSTNNFDKVPTSLRFYAGGDRSIRGFDYNRVSPTDADGNELGGDHLIVTSLEYQYRFSDNCGFALFSVQGKAFFEWEEPERTGVGFGLRWRSPVGPVRIDLGFPVSESDKSPRLHFSIGPEL